MSKVLTGANAVVKINGKTVAKAKNVSYSTKNWMLEPVIRDFLDVLARTGNTAARDRLAKSGPLSSVFMGVHNIIKDFHNESVVASGLDLDKLSNLAGVARHNNETDSDLRHRVLGVFKNLNPKRGPGGCK